MPLTLPPANSAGSKCWYALIDLPDDDRKQLDEWLADKRITGERIAAALRAADHKVNGPQIQNHRMKHAWTGDSCR